MGKEENPTRKCVWGPMNGLKVKVGKQTTMMLFKDCFETDQNENGIGRTVCSVPFVWINKPKQNEGKWLNMIRLASHYGSLAVWFCTLHLLASVLWKGLICSCTSSVVPDVKNGLVLILGETSTTCCSMLCINLDAWFLWWDHHFLLQVWKGQPPHWPWHAWSHVLLDALTPEHNLTMICAGSSDVVLFVWALLPIWPTFDLMWHPSTKLV